jgi:hypothetical protein
MPSTSVRVTDAALRAMVDRLVSEMGDQNGPKYT